MKSVDTGFSQATNTNADGIYSFPARGSGELCDERAKGTVPNRFGDWHHSQCSGQSFSELRSVRIGSSAVSITVTADQNNINTTDGTVSTVMDRQFAENLPMNGRSFQTLIELTPGVIPLAADNGFDNGQFSVNGQRGASNYWTVDGVSANIGVGASSLGGSNGFGGTVGSFSALGGTNSLVSVDAMQEFRIQTSTFAPEFGRTPGAQISIVTRSGTNQFHGTAYDLYSKRCPGCEQLVCQSGWPTKAQRTTE